MDRDDRISQFRDHLTNQMRARYGDLFAEVRIIGVEERNQRSYDFEVVSEGEADANGCREVHEKYKIDYEFKIKFAVYIFITQQDSAEIGRGESPWYPVVGEEREVFRIDCPPGLFDLKPVPENYALYRGSEMIWEGCGATVTLSRGGEALIPVSTFWGFGGPESMSDELLASYVVRRRGQQKKKPE